jgi:hypothetical protein
MSGLGVIDHSQCWICQRWTATDLISLVSFNGTLENVCPECREKLEERDRTLRAKKGGDPNAKPGQWWLEQAKKSEP